MQTWIAFHIYPLETPDVFLARALKPFLETHIWPTTGARAFFVRYDDEQGRHIRLRLRGERAWVDDTLRPAAQGWFADRGEVVEQAYEPETERFGGPERLAWAEEYFHLSTRVTLERLARIPYTYGDTLFDALRLHVITAFAAGLDREKTARYFGRLAEQWLPLFIQPEDGGSLDEMREMLQQQAGKQLESLGPALDELWNALENNKFDAGQPEWLRWLRGNQLILPEFGEGLERVLPSLLHLTNNRLGVGNPDEVYLCFLLR